MIDALDLSPPGDGQLVRITLTGRDPIRFDALYDRLFSTITETVEVLADRDMNPRTREILSEIGQAGKQWAEAKLARPSIENEKLISEITLNYAKVEEALASQRKVSAEAEAQELANARARLEHALRALCLLSHVKRSEDGSLEIDVTTLSTLLFNQ